MQAYRPLLFRGRRLVHHLLLAAVVVGLLGGVLLGMFLFGGVQPSVVQFMYLTILVAAASFKVKGGLVAAAALSLLLVPFVPDITTTNSYVAAWVYQTSLFLLFGGAAGYVVGVFRRRIVDAGSAVDHLSEVCVSLLSNLALIVEGRDKASTGHCNRVAHNAGVMGEALKLSSKQLETLHWGALLHDLGKIAVSERILLKPGALTEEEFGEIKHHSVYGAELLEAVSPEFKDIAQVVRCHHERWDGLGYPLGLGQEAIPLMSRIVTVADVFEALTSERPYRQPMRPAQALSYLKAEAGSHFDPELVTLFEELFKEDRVLLAKGAPEARVLAHDPNLRAAPGPSEWGVGQGG